MTDDEPPRAHELQRQTSEALTPIWSDPTLALPDRSARSLTIVRHRLRAAAYRIAADCERLLDTLDRPERELWRDAAGDALVASRHVLAVLANRPAGADPSGAHEQLAALYDQVREPRRRILESMGTLLGLVPTGPEEELLLEDARAIREAAIGIAAAEELAPPGVSLPVRPGVPPAAAGDRAPRLLVVDDEPASRRALSRLLERLGYEVAVAEDGLAAIEMAERQPADLILTDITMPELDGFELLGRLKAADRTRDIPVIVVSGLDDLHSVVRCIEHGAEDHITKPYEAVLLQARVRASLERKRMRDVELAYLRRVGQLTAAAEAVERDVYEPGSLDTLGSQDDELGRLARVFDRMVSGMRSREERLQRRLGHLRQEMRQARSRGGTVAATSSAEGRFAPGQLIAERYEIIKELGKGGMGTVYHARDRKLGEEIALKVVRGDLMSWDAFLVERLKSEIRLARRISHRNVVRTHDLGEWQGSHFLTMEYVCGISVEEMLDTQGTLSVESTLAIGTQLAEALAVAHEQQIIHRDIKPGNLLIDEAGILKVMDFGLARFTERTSRLTQAGFVVGTPGYLAPELHLGGDGDARSDLFSAGVVLYECLAGRAPFDASSPMAVVDRVLECRPAPVREVVSGVPPALAAVIERLLRREPRDRFGSARELAEHLGQIGHTQR